MRIARNVRTTGTITVVRIVVHNMSPNETKIGGNLHTQNVFPFFRIVKLIARFSKRVFWNLGKFWDRNR